MPLTRNQAAVAAALRSLGVGSPLYNLVASRPAVLDALSGGIQSSAITATAQTAFTVQETILDHLRFGEGRGFGGLTTQGIAPGTRLPATFTADLPGRPPTLSTVPVQFVDPRNYAIWGHAFGGFGATASTAGALGLSREVGGFVLGAETNLPADWRVGVATGFSSTSFGVRGLNSTGSVDSAYGAAYANGPLGPLQFRLGVAYTDNALDTRRTVALPGFSNVLTGRAGGDTIQGFGEAGYRFTTTLGYVEPFVGGAALRIHRDGFTERGGIAALAVAGRSYEIETATVGVQFQAQLGNFLSTDLPMVLRGLIGYRRAFGDVTPSALLAFAGGGQGFLTSGIPVDRDALIGSIGVNVLVTPSTSLGLAYTTQVGPRAEDHGVKGTFSYRF